MRIAVIGTGHMGNALGSGWSRAGHEVVFGTREPQEESDKPERTGKISFESVTEAVTGADVVVLALPDSALAEVISTLGTALAGKILVDCTNPMSNTPSAKSGGELVAQLAPTAFVVKAFNITGSPNVEHPQYPEGKALMLYAGDHAESKRVVSGLAADLGFDPVDAGPLAQAKALESMAMLWVNLAYRQKMGPGVALRLIRRDT